MSVLNLLRRFASHLPAHWQTTLRRHWCSWQIRFGRFNHDEPEFKRLSDWVSDGDCVIDIGANVGLFTAALSRLVGPNGHVFAFEPVPETFLLLTSNSRRFAYPNITLLNAAASDVSALVGMEIPTLQSGLSNIYEAHIVDSPAQKQTFAVPVDALDLPGKVTFCKIDVEGHEYKALLGMKNLLTKHGPLLVVEGANAAVNEFLSTLGYTGVRISGSPNTVFTRVAPVATDAELTGRTSP